MYPTPHTVTHRTFVKVGENAAGQARTEPRDNARKVSSLRPRRNDTGRAAALADRLITEYSMATPDYDWPHGSVVIDWHGREFTVHGDVEDFNGGPFGFAPGYLVTLRRVVQHALDDEDDDQGDDEGGDDGV